MENCAALVGKLRERDHNTAYQALQTLRDLSGRTDRVYPFLDEFARMISDQNSYVRTRGLVLIAANAKWDAQGRIDRILEEMLRHILDPKPITARQCIQSLALILSEKPALADRIRDALAHADTSVYNGRMRPLIEKDIASVLAAAPSLRERGENEFSIERQRDFSAGPGPRGNGLKNKNNE